MSEGTKGTITVLEGMSASGKTTMARELCRQRRSVYLPEAPEFVRYMWRSVDTDAGWLSNLRVNLDVGIERVLFADRLAQRGFDVVMDRSVLSPPAVAFAMRADKPKLSEAMAQLCAEFKNDMPVVDCRFLILDPPAAQWRRQLRQHDKAVEWPWNDVAFQRREQEFFLSLIPSSDLTTKSVRADFCGLYGAGVEKLMSIHRR